MSWEAGVDISGHRAAMLTHCSLVDQSPGMQAEIPEDLN